LINDAKRCFRVLSQIENNRSSLILHLSFDKHYGFNHMNTLSLWNEFHQLIKFGLNQKSRAITSSFFVPYNIAMQFFHLANFKLGTYFRSHVISRLTYGSPIWTHSLNFQQRSRIQSLYFNVISELLLEPSNSKWTGPC